MLSIVLVALAAAPVVHPLSWESVARFEDRALAGVQVAAFARSECVQGEQLLELELEGQVTWSVRCLQRATGQRATLACSLVPGGAVGAAHYVSLVAAAGGPWQGYRLTPGTVGGPGQGGWALDEARAVIGMDGREAGAVDRTQRYTYGLKFPDAQGHPTAHFKLGAPPALTVPEGMPQAEVELLAAISLAVEVAGDLRPEPGVNGAFVGRFLDGYRLVERAAPGLSQTPAPSQALTRISAPHGAALNDLLTRGARLQLDREAGPLVKREADLGRVVMEISGGALTAAGSDGGTPSGVDGFGITVAGGIRLGARTSVAMTMGIELGTLDAEGLEDRPGVTDSSSGGLGLGLHLRHALDLGLRVEPVLGLRVRGRLRSVDLLGQPSGDPAAPKRTVNGLQLGLGLAPTVGLQVPWTLNELDTRLVVFLEAIPEWSLWGDPNVDDVEGDPRVGLLKEAMGRDDAQITTQLGVRFEL